jgi:hypothetical protein
METLNHWNKIAFVVHAAAAIGSFLIISGPKEDREVNLFRTGFKEGQNHSRVDLPVELVDDFSIDLKVVVVIFFVITALAHWAYSTDFWGLKWYSKEVLGYGWNPYRWIEYSLSASLMTYLISIVSGTKDSVSALASALIVPSLMISGLTTERALNQNALHFQSIKGTEAPVDAVVVWANILPSWFLFFTNWYIILANYSFISNEASKANEPVDPTVSFMVYSQLFFFSMFGLVLSYQVYRWATAKRGRIEPTFLIYEKAYIVLSAVTKLLLAATVVYAIRN